MLQEVGRSQDKSEPEPERSDWKRLAPILGAVVLAVAGFGYAIHEHNNAQTANWQSQQMATQLDTTHKQLDRSEEHTSELQSP